MMILVVVLAETCALLFRVRGWISKEFQEVWKWILLLIKVRGREVRLLFTGLVGIEATNPWWMFLMNVPMVEEIRKMMWECLSRDQMKVLLKQSRWKWREGV